MGWADQIADQLGDRRGEPAPARKAFDAKALEAALSGGPSEIEREEPYTPPSKFDKYVRGPVQAAAAAVTGTVAAPIGAVAGIYANLTSGKFGTPEGLRIADERAREIADSLTYRPRSQGGQEALAALGSAIESSKLAGMGPTEMNTLAGISAGPRLVKNAAVPEARRFAGVGAEAASNEVQAQGIASRASPEIQQAVAKAGKHVDLETLGRHVEADSLPVPVRLTKGQATQDVAQLSNEQNLRAKHPEIAQRFDEQNKALIANTQAIKESAAPDIFTSSKVEHGDAMIGAYRTKDAALNANISNLYQKLRDANGGEFPLNGPAFVDSADAALHKSLLYDHLPAEFRKTMDRIKGGAPMTFENFESLRTNLARVQRSQTADGNAKAAAGIVRQSLEELPMPAGAEHLKPLADAARDAARARFALIEGDPAYKAVVNGKASADKFIDRYVVGADLKDVQTMKRNLAGDQHATQTIAAGTVDHLKSSAGLIGDTGNFSQAGYNKALEKIRPKLGVIFEPEQQQHLETLGRVARTTQAQPRGSYVNASNTGVVLIAEHAKGAAEGAANVAAGGFPLGTVARKIGGGIMKQRNINEALQTGAGIKLRDVGKR